MVLTVNAGSGSLFSELFLVHPPVGTPEQAVAQVEGLISLPDPPD